MISEIPQRRQWADFPPPKAGRNFFGGRKRRAKPYAYLKARNAGLEPTASAPSGAERSVRGDCQNPFCTRNPDFWTFYLESCADPANSRVLGPPRLC